MKKLFLTSSGADVLDKLIKYLPRKPKDLKVAFIPTAADPYKDKWFVKKDRDKLVKLGFDVFDVPIRKENIEKLVKADIIFVAGGNTFYLLQKAKESGFDKLIKKLVNKGTIYIGSSAGSVLVCPTIEPVKLIDEPKEAQKLKSYKGLNLVDFVILPHWGEKEFKTGYKKITSTLDKFPYKFIKINNKQIVLVDGDNIKII